MKKMFTRDSDGRTQELVKNSIVIGIGTICSKALSFILVPLYSIWMNPDQYGLYDLISSYVALAVPFATLQLEQAIYRDCVSDPNHSKDYFSTAFSLVLPLIALVAVVVLVFTTYVVQINCSVEFTLYFICFALFNIVTEYVRGNKELRLYSIANITSGIFIFIFSDIFIGLLSMGVSGALSAYSISYAIVALFLLIIKKPFSLRCIHPEKLVSMLRFSIPLIPNNVAWWITNVSNRTIISYFIGSYSNGLYAVCSKIPTFLSLMFNVINMAFQQTAIGLVESGSDLKYFQKLLTKLIKLLFSGCIVIICFVPTVYNYFIDQEYYSGMQCVPLLLAGTLLLCLAQYLGNILLAQRESETIGSSTIAAAIINVALNILFIKQFGLLSAAISAFLGYVVMFAIRLYKLTNVLSISAIVSMVVKWGMVYAFISLLALSCSNFKMVSLVLGFLSICWFVTCNRNELASILGKGLHHDN